MPEIKITIATPGKTVIATWDAASVQTTTRFWDCDCGTDYIHKADEPFCLRCGACTEASPDASLEEVVEMLLRETLPDTGITVDKARGSGTGSPEN